MNINKILVIGIILSVMMIHTASATEDKEYICVDRGTVKAPPPGNISGDTINKIEMNPLCPEGKVPKSKTIDKDVDKIDGHKKLLEQISKSSTSDISSADCYGYYCSDFAESYQFVDNDGASAYLTHHNPEVVSPGRQSRTWVGSGKADYDFVGIGWKKVRYDTSPKLYVFWDYKGTPQGNSKWVQYSNYYYPGMTLPTNGAYLYKVQSYFNEWWVSFNGQWVGYYNTYRDYDHGAFVFYAGEVVRDNFLSCPTGCYNSDMGNGLWPYNPNSAKIYNLKYLDRSGPFFMWANAKYTREYSTSPNLYAAVKADTGYSIHYGGPGSGGSNTPSITVIDPNGGEKLIRSSSTTLRTHKIQWRYDGPSGYRVRIELYKGGAFSKLITSSTSMGHEGLGTYYWTIPSSQVIGNDYKLKITSTSNSIYNDWSNNYFTIGDGYITVTAPNGGENWQRSTTKTITWTKTGTVGSYVKIELYKGGIFNRIISSSIPNTGSYNWYIPSSQTIGNDYKIKVTSTSNSIYNDWSNNNFNIY